MTPRHGCWRSTALAHPWEPRIPDVACGFDGRMTHVKCTGCHRQRVESPLDQLQALDARHTVDGLDKDNRCRADGTRPAITPCTSEECTA
jgi:hypothetical protein